MDGDIVTIILLSIYTIVNIVVFVIQRQEIRSIKSAASMIKDYAQLINVKNFKEYQSMREETLKHKITKDFSNRLTEYSKELAGEISKESNNIIYSKYSESLTFIVDFIVSVIPESELEDFLNQNLHDNKVEILKLLDKYPEFREKMNKSQFLTDE
jgi:hypothetical protein